jgi:hypothetical protein
MARIGSRGQDQAAKPDLHSTDAEAFLHANEFDQPLIEARCHLDGRGSGRQGRSSRRRPPPVRGPARADRQSATRSISSGLETAESGSAHDRPDRMGVASESPLESDRGVTREENARSGSRHPLTITRVLEGPPVKLIYINWSITEAIRAGAPRYGIRGSAFAVRFSAKNQ